MRFCSHCGAEVNENAVVCVNCGCSLSDQTRNVSKNDEISVGLIILSIFIPLFGIIYWPVKHKDTPKRASACGIAALISWGVYFIFGLLLFI